MMKDMYSSMEYPHLEADILDVFMDENSKSDTDSRCYIFDKQCELHEDSNSNHYVAVKGSIYVKIIVIDYPVDWTDKSGDSCHYYAQYGWCSNQTIGNNLNLQAFTFHTDYIYGLNAIQTCCECGGGAHIIDDVTVGFEVSFTGITLLENTKRFHHIRYWWNNLNLFQLCMELKISIKTSFAFLSNEELYLNH